MTPVGFAGFSILSLSSRRPPKNLRVASEPLGLLPGVNSIERWYVSRAVLNRTTNWRRSAVHDGSAGGHGPTAGFVALAAFQAARSLYICALLELRSVRCTSRYPFWMYMHTPWRSSEGRLGAD